MLTIWFLKNFWELIFNITIKELKEFIKDLPDKTKVLNNLAVEDEEVDLIYKKSTAYSDVLLIN